MQTVNKKGSIPLNALLDLKVANSVKGLISFNLVNMIIFNYKKIYDIDVKDH
jgi:hypothetical protein